MKVMILAAGRGERMGQLTDACPKPLLKVAGKSLIEHHIEALRKQGFTEFVINVAYLGHQIKSTLGDGQQWGVQIKYSDEGVQALETGGGLFNALPLLGEEPFLVVNADVWTNFPYATLRNKTDKKIHLVLVENPSHNTTGDFCLEGSAVVPQGLDCYTYSGVGVFTPSIFEEQTGGVFPLAPLIRDEVSRHAVSGQLHQGVWIDVGTPERLADVEKTLRSNQ